MKSGFPFSGIDDTHEVAVFEMGMSFDQINLLSKIVDLR